MPAHTGQAGITLVEVIISIVVVGLFSMVIMVNFPQIQRRYALSAGAYRLAQDLRRAQDLGLSGIKDLNNDKKKISAYGIFASYSAIQDDPQAFKKYILYANLNGGKDFQDQGTNNCPDNQPYSCCDKTPEQGYDCVIEVVDLTKINPNLYIVGISNLKNANFKDTSISFTPPNPEVEISNTQSNVSEIEITLGLSNDSSLTRKVYVNKSGLISVK